MKDRLSTRWPSATDLIINERIFDSCIHSRFYRTKDHKILVVNGESIGQERHCLVCKECGYSVRAPLMRPFARETGENLLPVPDNYMQLMLFQYSQDVVFGHIVEKELKKFGWRLSMYVQDKLLKAVFTKAEVEVEGKFRETEPEAVCDAAASVAVKYL